jgi:hypothetical protein
MKKRPWLGAITILVTVPSLLFLYYFVPQYQPSLLHWFILEKVFVSILGIVGGVLLWRGNIWGHRVALAAWSLVALISIASLISLYQAWGTSDASGSVATTWLRKDAIYLLFAMPMLFVIVRDLIAKKSRGKGNATL